MNCEPITQWLANEFRNRNRVTAIVGVSGGIDSAVVYLLCKKAGLTTIGIHLPCLQSSPESAKRARLLLEPTYRCTDISGIVSAAATSYDWNGDADRIRRGNLAARVRMMTLYDLAVEHNGLVVGTSNKTETMLGYGTRWGDTVCDINPLGSLLKREVRELAAALDVPQEIVDATPSADLWEGQTDEGELGFTYAEADAWLSGEYVELPAATRIAARVQGTEFKRESIPCWSSQC